MLTLRAGESSVVVAPETGGALLGWTFGGTPVLRRAAPDAVVQGDVRGLAGFPLLPFCNRIAQARFRWNGHDHQLDRNFGDHPHAIHGVGWQSAWTVEDVSATVATLHLVHRAAAADARRWPFAFEAMLRFELTEQSLQVSLALTNRHAEAAPAGLGLHPYFPRATFQSLRFNADAVWRTGADSLPDQLVPIPPAWDHRDGRRVDGAALDHCFTGWDGTARLEGRTTRLTIAASGNLPFLQVYTPSGQDFFCVEPVSHMPDAINRPDHAMQVLGPGEPVEARITFHVARQPPQERQQAVRPQ